MKQYQNEIIYIRAKELRRIVREKIATSFTEDSDLRDLLLKLGSDIPLHIGLSLNLNSLDQITDHLNDAKRKLTKLCVVIDLITNEYFKFDESKLNTIIDEIRELIPVKIQKAEEEEQKWLNEMMNEFNIKENEM